MVLIYEDKNFLVVNKPAGVLVHKTAKNETEETVVDWLLKKYPEVKMVGDNPLERPGIVHRLDKDTSGVLLIPRNQESFEYFKKIFQEHKIQKTYLALLRGKLQGSGVVDLPIGITSGTIKRSVRGKRRMVKEAVTEYRTLENFEKNGEAFTFVRLVPKTGRTHQLRVHMASIHHPVVGDVLYGSKKDSLKISRQFLHAFSLEFALPEGKRIRAEAELPKDL